MIKKWLFTVFTSFTVIFFCCGIGMADSNTKEIVLSDEEKNFIAEHTTIRIAVDPESIPYEFIDSDGIYKGIVADYVDIIEKRTGLNMVVEYGLSWPEAYEKAEKRELDVLTCISKSESREGLFIHTDPYYAIKRVAFINDKNEKIENFSDLLNKRVAVQANTSHYDFLQTYGTIKPSTYNRVSDALVAVSDGKEIAFVGNLATASYLIKTKGLTNLEYIDIESDEDELLYMAVRRDWPVLVGIINKGIASITEEEKIEINNKWLNLEENLDYSLIIRIVISLAVFIGVGIMVSAYWIFRLKNEVRERKRMEEELRLAKEEAELANNIKSTFLARMSHEIRTPLNAITGMSYLLKKTEVSITQKIYLDKITQASVNMLGIINDILDFSKIESGKVRLEKISFNLDKVLQQVVNIISYRIEEEEIEFVLDKDTDIPPYLYGDPTRLEQILLNLTNNAIKFTKKGSVSLSIRLIGKKDKQYHIQFIVKDSGIGMSGEQVEKLFEPFNQGDLSINRRFGGTGLGLSIVKYLVTMMDGEIEVKSELDKGSTFSVTVSLEADLDREEEQWKNKSPIADFLQKLKVIIVEKNIKSLQLLIDYLKALDINADYAVSEDAAFEIFEKGILGGKTYDLMILDYETPKDGGIAFYKNLKKKITSKNMPKTILLVPLMKEEIFDSIKPSGIDLGLSKPIIPSILYNGILEIYKKKVLMVSEDENLREFEYEKTSGGCHVLVVEDNKTNQFIAQSILEESGFIVTVADDGQGGYDFYKKNKNKINLILMDLHMPVLNGFETAALIRETDSKIPIIAMTADAISGVEEQCRLVGMTNYITKPFEPKNFIQIIKTVLMESEGDCEGSCLHEIKNKPKRMKRSKTSKITKILNREEGIKRVGGDEGIYNRVLAEFYKESKDGFQSMKDCIINKNYKEAMQIAHKIKGSSGSIGAKAMYESAADLQRNLETEETENIEVSYRKFAEVMSLLLEEIKEAML